MVLGLHPKGVNVAENGNGHHPKYPGTKVNLGGKEYVIPSLSVTQARELWPEMLKLGKGITTEDLENGMVENYDRSIKIIHAAISRNHPDVELDDIRDSVDIGRGESGLRNLLLIVTGMSGLRPEGIRPAAEEIVQ